MGQINFKIKLMPTSPSVNLEKIKHDFKSMIESHGGKSCSFTEEPIAFGLKAIIAMFLWPEEKEFEPTENKLSTIKDVSSVQVLDMRRAL